MSESANAIKQAKAAIDEYNATIMSFLNQDGKSQVQASVFMNTYAEIQRVSDECDRSDNMYQYYCEILTKYLQTRVTPAMLANYGSSGDYIVEYDKQWKAFTSYCFVLNKLFNYIDRYYLAQNKDSKLNSLFATARQMFKKDIFDSQIDRLQKSIMNEIRKDREDEVVNLEAIKTVIQQFIYMGLNIKNPEMKIMIVKSGENMDWKGEKLMEIYNDKFEKFLIEETDAYFMFKAKEWQGSMDCDQYIKIVAKHILKEETNSDFFYQVQTKKKLIDIVLESAVTRQAQKLTMMQTGCRYMFEQEKNDQLKTMYSVFVRVPDTVQHIINCMNPFILDEGKKLVTDPDNLKDPLKFTQALLDFKKRIDDLILFSFNNDLLFQKARDASFQEFMNTCKFTPHYIVIFADAQFKSGFKQKSLPEIELILDQVVRIFCCLHGRDVFVMSYTSLLAMRLLNKTSVNDEAEQSMVRKLQVECGHNVVSKIKTMFEDMTKSAQMMNDFKNRPGNKEQGSSVKGIEVSVEILTSGHWPFQELPKCNIPKKLSVVRDTFIQFYKKKFSNRQINYIYSNGSIMVQASYLKKAYLFNLSFYQCAICCLFNDKEKLTYSQIQSQLELSDTDMKESMMKLCNPKTGIIKKENSKKPVFGADEKLWLHTEYNSPNIRQSFIPSKTPKQITESGEMQSNIEKVEESVKQERAMVVDANVVRIMKARKVLMYNDLLRDVMTQITLFKAQPKDVKMRIESLIEREYLERDPTNKAKFIYKP